MTVFKTRADTFKWIFLCVNGIQRLDTGVDQLRLAGTRALVLGLQKYPHVMVPFLEPREGDVEMAAGKLASPIPLLLLALALQLELQHSESHS